MDLRRCFQDDLFLSAQRSCAILPLWVFTSNYRYSHTFSGVVLQRKYEQTEKGRNQHALLVQLFLYSWCKNNLLLFSHKELFVIHKVLVNNLSYIFAMNVSYCSFDYRMILSMLNILILF